MPGLHPAPLAAIDLGSNSFRLELGQLLENRYVRQRCYKSMVSLGSGLDATGQLSEQAIERGLACLKDFAEVLAKARPMRLRIVATQTLREARNSADFVRRAQSLLGAKVEVISGQEEARLIYAGVSTLHPSAKRRLVIDIGGRSTEMILGQGRAAQRMASFQIGSASLAQRCFPAGRIGAEGFTQARQIVRQLLGPQAQAFARGAWDEALGASGTAGMLATMLRAQGMGNGGLTLDGLQWLIDRCIAAGHVERLDLPGLKPERRALLPGGLALLHALAQCSGIDTMLAAKGALRQGVIVDLHERQLAEDLAAAEQVHSLPADALMRLQRRFGVDADHAQRVSSAALNLLGQLRPDAADQMRRELRWAAALHEIGMMVAPQGHHRHGAYLLRHAGAAEDLPAEWLERLSTLLLGQRGSLRKVGSLLCDELYALQLLCLRLALIVCHRRHINGAAIMPSMRLRNGRIKLSLPDGTALLHPRLLSNLRQEAARWLRAGGWELALAD